MDELQQLAALLEQFSAAETQQQQQFVEQCREWQASIDGLFDTVEAWLQPLAERGLVTLQKTPHVAISDGWPVETSPFISHSLTVSLAHRSVTLLPVVMGSNGQTVVRIDGLTSDRHGSVSLVRMPASADWHWRKERGAQEAQSTLLTPQFLALQLQGLIPKPRGMA